MEINKLLTVDNDGRLIIDNNAQLQDLDNTIILSMLGCARVGKSTYINLFLSYILKENISIVKASFGHKHCTIGIDYLTFMHNGKRIIVLDCQGLNHQNSRYDDRLMTFVYMVSDYIMYHENNIINNQTLQTLTMLCVTTSVINNNIAKPSLIFRIRDHMLDSTPDVILNDALEQCDDQYNNARITIKKIFNDINVLATVRLAEPDLNKFKDNNFYDFCKKSPRKETFVKSFKYIIDKFKNNNGKKVVQNIINAVNAINELSVSYKSYDYYALIIDKKFDEHCATINPSVKIKINPTKYQSTVDECNNQIHIIKTFIADTKTKFKNTDAESINNKCSQLFDPLLECFNNVIQESIQLGYNYIESISFDSMKLSSDYYIEIYEPIGKITDIFEDIKSDFNESVIEPNNTICKESLNRYSSKWFDELKAFKENTIRTYNYWTDRKQVYINKIQELTDVSKKTIIYNDDLFNRTKLNQIHRNMLDVIDSVKQIKIFFTFSHKISIIKRKSYVTEENTNDHICNIVNCKSWEKITFNTICINREISDIPNQILDAACNNILNYNNSSTFNKNIDDLKIYYSTKIDEYINTYNETNKRSMPMNVIYNYCEHPKTHNISAISIHEQYLTDFRLLTELEFIKSDFDNCYIFIGTEEYINKVLDQLCILINYKSATFNEYLNIIAKIQHNKNNCEFTNYLFDKTGITDMFVYKCLNAFFDNKYSNIPVIDNNKKLQEKTNKNNKVENSNNNHKPSNVITKKVDKTVIIHKNESVEDDEEDEEDNEDEDEDEEDNEDEDEDDEDKEYNESEEEDDDNEDNDEIEDEDEQYNEDEEDDDDEDGDDESDEELEKKVNAIEVEEYESEEDDE